ncbi:MAG: lytic transglycosylase domain-containing protein [Desulfobacteraceae bacterium]|nr:lytic transglycosylase domain-containing protein [Desulfobacteraceae bacterium]
MLKRIKIFLFVILIILFMGKAFADIYTFIDSKGIVHFTNVPTSSDYRLYIKEKPKKIKQLYRSRQYDDIIKKAQKRFGVEFYLIKAVIKIESNFNPDAVSKKGAKGLMQIMPGNFKSLLVKDPFNPSQNIMGGALYLQRLLKRYEYKLPLALAAYNAGPEAVDRYKRIPPYRETQNYVKKVMETYSQYKKS